MNKPLAKFIITRYKENLDWIKDYTDNFLVYNKSKPEINDFHYENTDDVQNDLWKFCYDNYENLPDAVAFLQGCPFDHCKRDIFDRLIYNATFTPLEYYGSTPANDWEMRTKEGGFMEINNSWYIKQHNMVTNMTCKYNNFDEFMNEKYINYKHLDWLRFSPGAQYLVEKSRILFYPKAFYKDIMEELGVANNQTEQYVVERSLHIMWSNTYHSRIK